jgi:hypothetical protein
MQLNELLDEIITREVYKGVKVECKLPYDLSELTADIIEKIKKVIENRLYHFATLFKRAIDKEIELMNWPWALQIVLIFFTSVVMVIRTSCYSRMEKVGVNQ